LWGSSLTAFRRNLPAQYENGFNYPIGKKYQTLIILWINQNYGINLFEIVILSIFQWEASLKVKKYFAGWLPDKFYNGFKKPSARKVSNQLISTSKVTPDREHTHMVMQWGQVCIHIIILFLDWGYLFCQLSK